ncbi:MAG TPA: molybdopterin-dependent oxidoreductase [Dehalococcoidia bacterium]|jgi:DMSO/TMAO reductase YedYZ molybdopterin-dependent catalytic subunit|nr:molybdopterin-dependent oxidoreductase [Dehalococcoidia bacterium]
MTEREIEGEWLMGWPDRRRPQPLQRKDTDGRVSYQRSPWAELQGLITPTDLRYVVAQLEIPEPLHPDDWALTVDGAVERALRLNLDDLRRLPGRTVRVVHECSGTDADFFDYLRDGGERPSQFDLTQPHTGQTSSGEFTGVPLATVLGLAGLKPGAVTVQGRGFDHGTPAEFATGTARYVPEDIHFEKALPLEKALDPDTILAWALNGEYLRHVHGAPLRLVTPGWSGNWSVKWLEQLEVRNDSPPLYYQTEYFVYGDEGDDNNEREMITTMGVRCVILDPRHDDSFSAGLRAMRGLAWSGGGRIERVEVSVDGGASWSDAHLEEPRERWLWTRWSHRWEPAAGTHTLMARATDEQGRVQPQTPWNYLRKNHDGIIPVDVTVA